MTYHANEKRYEKIKYRACGRSGGCLRFHCVFGNFDHVDSNSNMRSMVYSAFDLGVNHFDLANNYGPPPVRQRKIWPYIVQRTKILPG